MRTRLKISLLACMVLLGIGAQAQRKMRHMDSEKQEQAEKEKDYEAKSWRDKVKFGGNAWAQFGTFSSYFLLQPMVFYSFTSHTMAGVGVTYAYARQTYNGIDYSDDAYGGNIFGRQLVAGPLFVQLEYMPMKFTALDQSTYTTSRMWNHSLYLGGGVQNKFSERGGTYIVVMYDLLWDARTANFRPTPWDIRVGFFF